jgi:hypothetical protein
VRLRLRLRLRLRVRVRVRGEGPVRGVGRSCEAYEDEVKKKI